MVIARFDKLPPKYLNITYSVGVKKQSRSLTPLLYAKILDFDAKIT
jgi:hypothetical protein